MGIPEVAKPADLAARGGCWFESGSVKVHLGIEAAFTFDRNFTEYSRILVLTA